MPLDKYPFVTLIFSLAMSSIGCAQKSSETLAGPYLGLEPPGLTPELFAPGLVATENHRETVVTFLPNMKEFAFTRLGGEYTKPELIVMHHKDNQWHRKAIPSSAAKHYGDKFNPSYSDIRRLDTFKDIPIEGAALSAKGTYYFYVLNYQDGSGHLSYSRLVNGQYQKPQKMSEAINRGKYIAHPYVAPDESYIMWDAEKLDENTPDIYISFKQDDGSWGDAINMGETINTDAYEQRPRVTPDGKYLFFWRGDKKTREDGSTYWEGNPYWVDAKFIDTLRPKSATTLAKH